MADPNMNKNQSTDKTGTDKMGQTDTRKPEQGNLGSDRNREQGGLDKERTDKERTDKERAEQGRDKSAIGGGEKGSTSGQGMSGQGTGGQSGQNREFDKSRSEPTSR